MDRKTQDLAWSILPKEFREEVKYEYSRVATKAIKSSYDLGFMNAHDGGVYDYDIVFLPNAVDCDCPIDRATFSRTYEEALSEGITSVLELIKKARNLFRRNSDFF